MKPILLVLAFTALATASIEWKDLRVKWGYEPNGNNYFAIPRTKADALEEGWVVADGANSLHLPTYCMDDDPRFCVIFDSYGYIGGFQAGVLVSDLADTTMDYDITAQDSIITKTVFDREVHTSTIYTVPPATLIAGGRSDWDGTTGTDGIHIELKDGSYYSIPRNQTEMLETTPFTEQACFIEMGIHFYYNMTKSMDRRNFFPWFLMCKQGEILGVGFQTFGIATLGNRSWYDEGVTTESLKAIVTTQPDDLVEYSDSYGIISMHIYFVERPWLITCS